eukprot:2598654-Alexandrium_andersonii.AAC.1
MHKQRRPSIDTAHCSKIPKQAATYRTSEPLDNAKNDADQPTFTENPHAHADQPTTDKQADRPRRNSRDKLQVLAVDRASGQPPNRQGQA